MTSYVWGQKTPWSDATVVGNRQRGARLEMRQPVPLQRRVQRIEQSVPELPRGRYLAKTPLDHLALETPAGKLVLCSLQPLAYLWIANAVRTVGSRNEPNSLRESRTWYSSNPPSSGSGSCGGFVDPSNYG